VNGGVEPALVGVVDSHHSIKALAKDGSRARPRTHSPGHKRVLADGRFRASQLLSLARPLKRVFIQGREVSTANRQTRLTEKYEQRYRQMAPR